MSKKSLNKEALNIIVAQIKPKLADLDFNAKKIIKIIEEKQEENTIIVFPELALTGYALQDKLLHQELFYNIDEYLDKIRFALKKGYIIIGHPYKLDGVSYNAASIYHKDNLYKRYYKQKLAIDSVFDEARYFTPSKYGPCIIEINQVLLGVCICEDFWHEDCIQEYIDANIQKLIVINASPYDITKNARREALARSYSKQGIDIVYVNMIGMEDELIFDGQSFIMQNLGSDILQYNAFREEIGVTSFKSISLYEQMYAALVFSLQEYLHLNNFNKIVLGLSGGIDSALSLCIAVDAIGPDRVSAITMPSKYTDKISIDYAVEQAKLLGVKLISIPIEPTLDTVYKDLNEKFTDKANAHTAQNLQARVRALYLMAWSNQNSALLLSTSNKSESAVGYCTLYGDMCGGFAILKDVYKTQVYALSYMRNRVSHAIPVGVLERAPTAELAHNQLDEDTLPPYTLLDDILKLYIEHKYTVKDFIKDGFDASVVEYVISLVLKSEFKRYQAPPGPRITPCAFGKDWRYPISI